MIPIDGATWKNLQINEPASIKSNVKLLKRTINRRLETGILGTKTGRWLPQFSSHQCASHGDDHGNSVIIGYETWSKECLKGSHYLYPPICMV